MRERCFFPIERTAEVLHTWRQWTDTVPDEVTSIGRILRLPSLPEIPEFMRGRAWAMVEAACLGGAVVGADLIRPLRALGPELDTFATIPAPGSSDSTWNLSSRYPPRATARSRAKPQEEEP
jgi:hypothetical protein